MGQTDAEQRATTRSLINDQPCSKASCSQHRMMVHGNHVLKRPGAYGSTESSPKRLCSSPDASSVGASPLSSNTNNSFLSAQYSPCDENHHCPQTSEHADWDMTDAPENSHPAHVEQDSNEDIICYGAMICEARASLQVSAQLGTVSHNSKRFHPFEVVRVGQFYGISMLENTKPFAHLDRRTCIALESLDSIPNITAKAMIDLEQLKQVQNKSKPKSGKQVSVSINIHGSYRLADQVDSVLSRTSTFLQHPFFLGGSCQYYNPQIFRSGTEMENLTHLVGLTEFDLKAKVLSDEVEGIFESLGDVGIHTPGHSIPAAANLRDVIATGLMSHQTEALKFIQIREDHNWCQAARSDLQILTKIPPGDAIPSYATGGILADAMGLGKTLTMLSAIVSTAEHARMWALSPEVDAYTTSTEARWRTRATLIVVTSIQVLDVWEAEINKHIKPSALKTCVFHGKTRSTTPDHVIDHDVVITTYGLLVSDYKNHRVLQQIDWYRVLLDEAHWIRNQGSDQFMAAHNLHSVRRWCLTGTPIQNRLDDLVALLNFLQFQPFARSSIFRRHILEPLTQDSPDRTLQLKALLRTICLRRNERLLNLPKPQDQEINIDLNPDERLLYNDILKKCVRDIDDVISNKFKLKRYSILFTAIMKLRRVCNHGTHPVGNKAVPQADSAEEDCELCGGPANEDTLDLANIGNICPQCGRSLLTTASRQVTEASHAAWLRPLQEIMPPLPHSLSTKLQAVVDNIIKSPYGSKSLVFSYWTATLDMLERHLQQIGLSYLRIDGRVPYKDRLDVLERFKISSAADTPVLLMSIQTGAVGLNLTVANYVHIVEPQWNPSVEDQAIARAVRLGQERTVTIVRYIVKNSIEANILNLQKKKRSLAKFTLDTGTSGSGDAFSDGLEDLKFVLDFDSL